MKFADGYWLTQRGYSLRYAGQAYEVETDRRSVHVLATPSRIWNRGQTLGGPNLELTFTAVMEDVIRVSIVHYRGSSENAPKFELNEDPDYTPVIERTDRYVEMTAGGTRVRIGLEDWDVQYFYRNKRLTGGASRSLTNIEE